MYRGRIRLTSPMLWFLGFVGLFSVGGVAGVVMALPAADFQLHNSLFLVAHFHTMIVGGVLFGFFAGLTYWFPKIFGFTLNERLGKCAFWCWMVGFLLAFIPLYILGFLGATRRIDHYSAALGWQWLFIVAAGGAALVCAGLGFQILQLIVSIYRRNNNRDKTGDAWEARTLEWSTPSPAPIYNFAVVPVVTDRDQYWVTKLNHKAVPKIMYEDIAVPKNSSLAVAIAAGAFTTGFSIIWHIWWLALVGVIAVVVIIIVRSIDDETERIITASDVRNMELSRREELRRLAS